MSKNLFELSEEEKNRIRGLHESYTNKPGTKLIWEQSTTIDPNSSEFNTYYFGVPSPKSEKLYIEGDSIYYFNGQKSTKIWDKTTKTAFAVDSNTGKIEVGSGLMEEQEKLQNLFRATLIKKGLGPLQSKFGENDVVYLVQFGDNGGMFLNSASAILLTEEQAKKAGLKKAKLENGYYYADYNETYIPTKGGVIVTKLGFGKQLRKEPITPTPPPTVVPDYTFTLTDVFKFDSDELKDPSSLDAAIEKFISFMDRVVERRSQYNILNTDVKILGYASSDGNPEELDGGNLPACSQYGKGKGPRKDYDKCLSQKRAEVVAKRINDTLKSIPIMVGKEQSTLGKEYRELTSNWAKAVGMGQNSDVSGIKWNTPGHTVEKTAPDRRIVFTPTLTTKS